MSCSYRGVKLQIRPVQNIGEEELSLSLPLSDLSLLQAQKHCPRSPYNIDVTLTELSADPVRKMGIVGCQSTVVIAAVCGRVLKPFL